MTDTAGPTTPETPGGGRGDERLARAEELTQLGQDAGPTPQDSGAGGSPGPRSSYWPVVTVVLLFAAAWTPVLLTLLRTGIDPDPFAFHTNNVFWVLTTVGSGATLTLAVAAAGLPARAGGATALRVAATVVVGAQLVVLAVIAVIQIVKDARASVMTETVVTIVAVVLAGVAVVLAVGSARSARRTDAAGGGSAPSRAPTVGLACVLVGQVVLAVATTARFPDETGFYVATLLISTFTSLASLTGLWLVCRPARGAAWAGAGTLCLLAVLSLGSLVNVFALADLPVSHRVVETAQYVLYATGAVAALLAARATGRTAPAR
ncbi:hypothetical protein GCM10028784_28590 [Myceligenerans cantabricum]